MADYEKKERHIYWEDMSESVGIKWRHCNHSSIQHLSKFKLKPGLEWNTYIRLIAKCAEKLIISYDRPRKYLQLDYSLVML